MALPVTPTKRILTEDAHKAFIASRTPFNAIISDDLTARLQNIGSRVRKRVNEGYATQRYGSVPSAPYPSPAKPADAAPATTGQSIFRSANDTLLDVFSSPTRVPTSPSPSPKKRSHAELDEDVLSLDADGDAGMDSDEESITFIVGPNPNRPVKPLKKSSSSLIVPSSGSGFQVRGNLPPEVTGSPTMHVDMCPAGNANWADMFNQPF